MFKTYEYSNDDYKESPMNPTTVGELKAKLSEYDDDELVLVDGMYSDRDIASVEYDAAVEGMKKGYLVICGTSEGMQ